MLILLASSSNAQQNEILTRQDKKLIINKTISLLNENYIFPARVSSIEKYTSQRLKAGAYDSLNNTELFLEALNADLERSGNDHHLDISYSPERVRQILANEKNEKDGKEEKPTAEWLQRMQYENFRLRKLERLDGNIGYFYFLGFTPLPQTKQSIVAAMNFIQYSNAIIIDLRDNGGGYAETMNFMLSYFMKDSVQTSELRYRQENKIVRMFTPSDPMINKIPDSIPLFILVSNRTSSAAEAFAYALQQNKRATIVGQQTRGEGNPGRLFVINDQLYIMIPTAEAINSISKKSIDGIGVIPDIKIEKEKAYTEALLKVNCLLASKTDIKELKLLYQWQVPFLENLLNPEPLTQNIINSLIGDYEDGRKIVYENGSVFYLTTKGQREKLDYIGKGVFQNANKNWLRLQMPSTDKPIDHFTWIWDDGGQPQVVKKVVNK